MEELEEFIKKNIEEIEQILKLLNKYFNDNDI